MSDELFDRMTKQLADMRQAMTTLYNELDETSDNNYFEIRRIQTKITINQAAIDELERGIDLIMGKGNIEA